MSSTLANSRRLSINALFGMLLSLSRLPLTFIMTPIYIAFLGTHSFGTWALLNGIVLFTSFSYLGMPSSITKHVAHHYARGERRELNALINSSNLVHLGLALAVAVVFLGMWPALVPAFFTDVELSLETIFITYVLLLVGVIVGLLGNSYSSMLHGIQRTDMQSGISLTSRLLMAVAGWMALRQGYGMAGLAAAGVVGEAYRVAAIVVVCRRLVPEVRFQPLNVRWDVVREVTSFGAKLLLGGGAMVAFVQIDKMLLDRFSTKVAVGLYAIVSSFCMQLRNYPFLMQRPTLAATSELSARGERVRLERMYRKAQKYGLLLATMIFAGVAALGAPFLDLWIGDQYTPAEIALAAWALRILAAGHLLAAAGYSPHFIAIGLHRPGISTRATLVTAGLNLVLSVALGWVWGFYGIVIASSVAMTAGAVYLCQAMTRRSSLRIYAGIWHGMARPLVAAGAATAAGRFVLVGLDELTWWTWFAAGAAFTVSYVGMLLLLRHISFVEFVQVLRMKPDNSRTESKKKDGRQAAA